jgi:hypothetical protein
VPKPRPTATGKSGLTAVVLLDDIPKRDMRTTVEKTKTTFEVKGAKKTKKAARKMEEP